MKKFRLFFPILQPDEIFSWYMVVPEVGGVLFYQSQGFALYFILTTVMT